MKCHDAEEANLIISDVVPTLAKEYRFLRASLGKERTAVREIL